MRTSQPGSQGQASAVRWLQWLPLAGLVGILVLVALTPGAPSGMTLSYSQFLGDVGAGTVRAVTIGPVGQVTGRLVSGQPFTTTIPVALDDRTLPGQLTAHHVQVSATAAGPSSVGPVLIGLLLLVLVGGLFYIAVRGARPPAGRQRSLRIR